MVGGCCELSTSVHHLVDRLGVELGYRMSEDTGYDVEDCITCATKGLKLRVARRVWRDYYRHSFARRHNADPSTEGLADQQRVMEDPGGRLASGGTGAGASTRVLGYQGKESLCLGP